MLTNTFAERLKEAMELKGIRQKDIASQLRIDKGQLSAYLAGRYKPKQDTLNQIAAMLDVNAAWLLGYDVPSGRECSSNETSYQNIKINEDNPFQLIKIRYEELNEDGKKELAKRADELVHLPQYCNRARHIYEEDYK